LIEHGYVLLVVLTVLHVLLPVSCLCVLLCVLSTQDAPKAVEALTNLNVPYLVSLPLVFQTTEEWLDSELGVHPVQVALQVRGKAAGCGSHSLGCGPRVQWQLRQDSSSIPTSRVMRLSHVTAFSCSGFFAAWQCCGGLYSRHADRLVSSPPPPGCPA
jgi:hypothetical protein